MEGKGIHKAPSSANIALHTSNTIYEIALLLTQNWNSREVNVLPIARNLKVRANRSDGDMGDRILVAVLAILGLITLTRR